MGGSADASLHRKTQTDRVVRCEQSFVMGRGVSVRLSLFRLVPAGYGLRMTGGMSSFAPRKLQRDYAGSKGEEGVGAAFPDGRKHSAQDSRSALRRRRCTGGGVRNGNADAVSAGSVPILRSTAPKWTVKASAFCTAGFLISLPGFMTGISCGCPCGRCFPAG